MREFIISTDTTCDLPEDYCRANKIDIHPLFYRFGENEIYGADKQLDPHDFYERMRNGEMPTTMATNPEDSKELFKKRLDEGYDIIHIGFSSGLSSSCQNASLAANELLEEYPEARIVVIDSLAASMGEGLLVHKAIAFQKEGHSFDETVQYIEGIRNNMSHQFTVDSLFHLHRGGRVSKATAIIGTLVGIKPLLHVDNEGHLIAVGKTRGRKKSLTKLVDTMVETMGSHPNDLIMISHGDCLEDAEFVASLIKERTSVKKVLINYVCPTIGAHAGPGVVALFFEADHK